jgi:L-threonylcarbamoyladenylate synthase
VARLYAAKSRPSFNPLIAHVADAEAARRLARFDAAAEKLAAAFWPGPLTLVLPKRPDCGVADLALAGLDSVAVRVPAHRIAHALLAAFNGPVVAPSANRSGHLSPTSAAHVLADLRGRIDMVIDAGPCAVGVESTIVACLGEPTLLRPGGLPRDQIERVLGQALAVAPIVDDAPLAPGMLFSHYAPKARLRLDAEAAGPDEALLAFGPAPVASVTLNLSPRGDLIEAAANLFSHLRALDASGAQRIAVMKVPHEGLGEAINDRLARAAAPKAGISQ